MDYRTQSPEEVKRHKLFEAQSYLSVLAQTTPKEWRDSDSELLKKNKEIFEWDEFAESFETYVEIDYFNAVENILQNSKMLEQKGIAPEGFVQELLNEPLPKSEETLLTRALKNVIETHGNGKTSETTEHIDFLIAQGADVNAPNKKNQYPVEFIMTGQKKGMKDSDFGIIKCEGKRVYYHNILFDGYQTVEDYIISHTSEKTHAALRNKKATGLSILSKIRGSNR